MKLESSIAEALELTRALRDALDNDDVSGALGLLPARGVAMARFQDAHTGATGEERASCRTLLLELTQLDATLQEQAGARLEDAARSLHAAAAGPSLRPDQNPCRTGCFDRHV